MFPKKYTRQSMVTQQALFAAVSCGDAARTQVAVTDLVAQSGPEKWCHLSPRLLKVALWSGHLQVLDLLLALGADRDAIDQDGNTVVHLAAYWNHLPSIQCLLDHGADAHSLAPLLERDPDDLPLWGNCVAAAIHGAWQQEAWCIDPCRDPAETVAALLDLDIGWHPDQGCPVDWQLISRRVSYYPPFHGARRALVELLSHGAPAPPEILEHLQAELGGRLQADLDRRTQVLDAAQDQLDCGLPIDLQRLVLSYLTPPALA